MAFFRRLMTAIQRQTIVQLLMSFANITEPMVAFTHLPVYCLLLCASLIKNRNQKRSANGTKKKSDFSKEDRMKSLPVSQRLLQGSKYSKNARAAREKRRPKKETKSPTFVPNEVIALNFLQKKMITLEPNAPIRTTKEKMEKINSKKKQLKKKKSLSKIFRPPILTSITVAPAPLPPRALSFSISHDLVQLKSIVKSSPTGTAQKSVTFGTCIFRYFQRSHGACVIPEEAGDATTLGLGEEYPFSEINYPLCAATDTDEDSIWSANKVYRSAKLSIKERQMLLLAAGVQLNSDLANECRLIQRSRQRIGCSCRGRCDATHCECVLNGINCQGGALKSQIACSCDPMKCGQRVNASNQENSPICYE